MLKNNGRSHHLCCTVYSKMMPQTTGGMGDPMGLNRRCLATLVEPLELKACEVISSTLVLTRGELWTVASGG